MKMTEEMDVGEGRSGGDSLLSESGLLGIV